MQDELIEDSKNMDNDSRCIQKNNCGRLTGIEIQ